MKKTEVVEVAGDLDAEASKTTAHVAKILRNRSDDFDYGRELMYVAAERLQDVLEAATNLARESEHPRAMEVAANAADTLAGMAKKFMDHHGSIEKLNNPGGSKANKEVINNNLNVKLSTKDLLELIKRDD